MRAIPARAVDHAGYLVGSPRHRPLGVEKKIGSGNCREPLWIVTLVSRSVDRNPGLPQNAGLVSERHEQRIAGPKVSAKEVRSFAGPGASCHRIDLALF